jgi:acetoin utilization protein AcuB
MSEAEATMTRDVIYVPPEVSLRHAWGILQRWRIRHLPVVSKGTLVGIISDRDALLYARRESDGSISVPETPLAAVMTRELVTCARTTSIHEVARMMIENKIDSLLVVDPPETLVGLVTSTDLLALLVANPRDMQAPLPFRFDLHSIED